MKFSFVELEYVDGSNMNLTAGISNPVEHVLHLKEEIAYLKTKVKEYDTGHIKTAIGLLENRVEDLSAWIVRNY